ncbi:MAG: zinc ribbon domain-containing protein, partial [Tetragenococcus koreensis]|nr:zinc ribbon domain-containing protein [Tetragenococcus koreensis]
MKYCDHCKMEYPDDQNFCENCGKNLVEKEEVKSDEIICPNCGKENQATAHFCEFCGTNLQEKRTQETKTEPSKFVLAYRAHKKLYNILLIAVVTLLIVGVGLYKYGEIYYSKESQIERYQDLLAENDPEKLADSVVSSDKNFKPTAQNLRVFTNYTKDN